MRLGALTNEMVQRAIAIYQRHAYGMAGRAARGAETPNAGLAQANPGECAAESLLATFHYEQVETVPGHPCCRYSLRLGNRNYPFMKLLLQEHLVKDEFFFAVDTHDQLEIKPEFPDYAAWNALRKFNRELKLQIEAEFAAAGLDTCAMVRRLLTEGACDEVGLPAGSTAAARTPGGEQPCRGLALIVDDEEDLAAAVEVLLRRAGYRTYTVYDGKAGVLAARELLPDLVLLDYELPELDGLEVLAQLRADPATRGIPVLLNSAGRVTLSDIKKADGFLAKPYPESLLYEMIDRVLRNRQVQP